MIKIDKDLVSQLYKGQIFKSKNELYRALNLSETAKKSAKDRAINRYLKFEKLHEHKNEIVITEIFDKPLIKQSTGKYNGNLEVLISSYLNKNNRDMEITVSDIIKDLKLFPEIKSADAISILAELKNEVSKMLYPLLQRYDKEKIIRLKKYYAIELYDKKDNHMGTEKITEKEVKKVYKQVLKDNAWANVWIAKMTDSKKFYKQVNNILSEDYGNLRVKSCYAILQIKNIDVARLPKYTNNQIDIARIALNGDLCDRFIESNINSYENQTKEYKAKYELLKAMFDKDNQKIELMLDRAKKDYADTYYDKNWGEPLKWEYSFEWVDEQESYYKAHTEEIKQLLKLKPKPTKLDNLINNIKLCRLTK